jgi:glycosyltransferase involved in cell wall biosynthesis
MRVLHLNSNRWNSAITEYALSLGRAFRALDAASLCVGLDSSPYLIRAHRLGFEATAVGSFGFGSLGIVKKIIEEFKPTHIICYGGPETTLCRFLPGTYKIIRFKGQASDSINWLNSTVQKISWSFLDLILTPSLALANEVAFGDHCHVLELGCDQDKFFFDSKNFVKSEVSTALIFGRFDPVKGHREFIEIFAEAKKVADFPIQLKIVGEPANVSVAHLDQWTKEAGLVLGQDVVIDARRVPDVAALMTGVDLGVVSSVGSEYICRVAQEFLLCGTRIFVSGVGSLAETIKKPTFGQSYKSNDNVALALVEELRAARCESVHDKQLRAADASGVFSLDAMSYHLQTVLAESDA